MRGVKFFKKINIKKTRFIGNLFLHKKQWLPYKNTI